MSVIWDGYTPFDPGVDRPLDQLSRREARAAFDRLMAAKSQRIDELRQLLAANGLTLDGDDGVQQLNDWFHREVESDPATGRLRNIWYAVVNDISLFLGDVMIKRSPNLSWVFFTKGKKMSAFQRHVIMGFTKVANPDYYIDIDIVVATYGVRVVREKEVDQRSFVNILADSAAKA
jgi:hypothetical protein